MPLTVRSVRSAPPAAAPFKGAALPFGLPEPPGDWPQKAPGISLCMIVKDEERFLARCLQSVRDLVDEINVVDTGSTDDTIAIARSFGANVEQHPWRRDFAWARNKSLDMAKHRWILQLDADEELLPESADALRELRSAPAHLTGVWVRCGNASDRYKGGGTISHAIIRAFPNHPRIRYHGAIHEFPSIDDSPYSMSAVVAPIKIVHHGYLSDVVAARKKHQRNLALIEQSVQEEPDDAFHWYNLGTTRHLCGDHEGAATALERMWELCLQHGMRAFTANGLQVLADTYSEHLGRPEKGLEYALECLRRSPRYANAHFSAGKAYFLLTDYEKAREMYRCAIDDAEHLERQFVVDDEVPQWKAHCEIGSTYAEQGEHARALEWFEKGLANRPGVAPLRVNYAKSLEACARFAEAERALKALFDEFGDEHAAVELVNYYLRQKRHADAVALIEKTYAKLSDVAATSMLLAAAHVTAQEGGDPSRYVDEALRIDPDNAQALAARAAMPPKYVLALGCARAGDKVRALEHLAKIENGPNEANAWLLKATLLREIGEARAALDALAHVCALDPCNVDALLMRAALHESLGEVHAAEEALRQALIPAKTRASVELAALYLRTGRFEEARRVADAALA